MAQSSSSRTVKIGDQPVSVDDVSTKDLLAAILEQVVELNEIMQLMLEGGGR